LVAPEAKARERIDRALQQCGWLVQDRLELNISAGPGITVRESATEVGEADYLLYAHGKVIGVVEAKPEGHTLTGVETPSGQYVNAVAPEIPAYRRPPRFCYESTGTATQFTNTNSPTSKVCTTTIQHLLCVGLTSRSLRSTFYCSTALLSRPNGVEYGHTESVADGVNMGFDVYRILTRITAAGRHAESGA
jgi:type I site-specific restriction endonuclease